MNTLRRLVEITLRRSSISLGLAVVVLGCTGTPALAVPAFDVELERDMPVISHQDGEVDYTVKIKNTAAPGQPPEAGDQVTCENGGWSPVGAVGFSYQWIRNGTSLGSAHGAQTAAYEVQPADAGNVLQCLVTGANPAALASAATGTGKTSGGSNEIKEVTVLTGTFAVGQRISAGAFLPAGTTITGINGTTLVVSASAAGAANTQRNLTASNVVSASTTSASLPVTVVRPQSSAPPPSTAGNSGRPVVSPNTAVAPAPPAPGTLLACTPPASGWTGFPTATTTSGSPTLSQVSSATGVGVLTTGSPDVSGLVVGSGAFEVGQTVSGVGVPAGATVAAVGPGSLELSAPATASGSQSLSAGAQPFSVGQAIGGVGIPTTAGTGTVSSGSETVTATALTPEATATQSTSFVVGQTISGAGIPAGTTITAVSGAAPQTLTLSGPATASGTNVSLSAVTTITSISSQTVTLSSAATATATGVSVFSDTTAHWSYSWVRNAVPFGGSSSGPIGIYRVAVGDGGTAIQCRGAVEDVNHLQAAVFSGPRAIGLTGNPVNTAAPAVAGSGSTFGPVSAVIELPGGTETRVFSAGGNNWGCTAVAGLVGQPARAICNNANSIPPQASFQEITVKVALGSDAPDHSVVNATVSGGGAASASALDPIDFINVPFGLSAFDASIQDQAGQDYTQAGGHPFSAGTTFAFNLRRQLGGVTPENKFGPVDYVRRIIVDAPRGFVGSVRALTPCPSAQETGKCGEINAIGGITIHTSASAGPPDPAPIYAVKPERGVPAQFVFTALNNVYSFSPRLRADDGYAISFESAPTPASASLKDVDVTLCDFGVRLTPSKAFAGCKASTDPDANPLPLITNPTRCMGEAPRATIHTDSYENPGDLQSRDFANPPLTGCDQVEFEPRMHFEPSSHRADSPTGMDVEIEMPTDGLESRDGFSQANLKRAVVTFPKGMAINASAGSGLGGCSAAEIGLGTNDEVTCPASSKIGTVEIETPLISNPLTGSIYISKQKDNPFKSAIGLYLVFGSKDDGILIKVPGKVVPDPDTGQLVVTFDDSPEAPFSRAVMHFAQGPRAALTAPPKCGSYTITAELSPWTAADPGSPLAEEIVTETSNYDVTEGPGGGPCPRGDLQPQLEAGSKTPVARQKSPFLIRLSRADGSQRFTAIDVTTPPGLTAYLNGIPYCPDAALAAISSAEETGQSEIDHPSCPAASQIGTSMAGAGAGPEPFFVDTGRAYLAGPYRGAPLSLALVTPAVAGPFDLGSVVVRAALRVDSATAQITAVSDPIPTIRHGIPLDIRDIRVAIDRPGFVLNPTNCEPLSVNARVAGDGGGTASVADGFQVGGCANLPFKPELSTRVFGGTKRGDNPRFRAVLTANEGEANIAKVAVTLPHSEFLDQSHIRTVCTRVQFAADSCPQGAIYGYAKAFTPLLDYPLEGPVYLRSSDHPLPDLVISLRGPAYQPLEIDLVARVDSVNGGIRTRLEAAPDAPVSKFILEMRGGRKGLLVNSRALCRTASRTTVKMDAQNGKIYDSRPLLKNDCGKKARKKRER